MANCKKCGKYVLSGPVFHSACWAEVEREIEELKSRLESAVELPCTVGDTMYVPYVYNGVSGISHHEIGMIVLTKIGYEVVAKIEESGDIEYDIKYGSHKEFGNHNYNINWFLDIEQAEARLKELRDEQSSND